ncbi:hypothetical protein M422DRAFT_245139 [Sphaerobolus stellatus SS14]|nr:hypothetical protein M422DRAFT_245139 [Sphaerobolus stellatus SS14]
MTGNEIIQNIEIDEAKLSRDNGEIYLFQWLCSTEKAPDNISAIGRPIRQLATRCSVKLYTRGETRTLFDTLQALIKVVSESKIAEKDKDVRVAALPCIGDIMGTFISQYMSLMVEIALVSLKILKALTLFCCATMPSRPFSKSLSTAARALTESIPKDIIKQMKHALSDKALPTQRAVADVLVVILCVKSLEGADQLTRHSLAQLAGHILASTQAHKAPPLAEPAKNGKQTD